MLIFWCRKFNFTKLFNIRSKTYREIDFSNMNLNGRALHFVFKIGNRKCNLKFFKDVLGMKVNYNYILVCQFSLFIFICILFYYKPVLCFKFSFYHSQCIFSRFFDMKNLKKVVKLNATGLCNAFVHFKLRERIQSSFYFIFTFETV